MANAGQPDPPFTRAGSQDDVSYTNSLKLDFAADYKTLPPTTQILSPTTHSASDY